MNVLVYLLLSLSFNTGSLSLPHTSTYRVILDEDTIGTLNVYIDSTSLDSVEMFQVVTVISSNLGNIERKESTIVFVRRDNLSPILSEKLLTSMGDTTKITTFYSSNKAKLILSKGNIKRKLELDIDERTFDWDELFIFSILVDLKKGDSLNLKILSSLMGNIQDVLLKRHDGGAEGTKHLSLHLKKDTIHIYIDEKGVLEYRSTAKNLRYTRV